jgi:MFS family permease
VLSRRTLLLATIASATLLTPLNSSMISVALPSLGDEFGLSFAGVTWIVSIFYLTAAVAQPVVGRLGDLYGKRRVFFSGIALVAASSLLAPFSPGFSGSSSRGRRRR